MILKRRKDAYQDNVLNDGIIRLSAALVTQDHGDARKAREIADRETENIVHENHVRHAQKEARRDRTPTQMQGLSIQKKLSLYATAVSSVYSQCNLDAIPSTVAYRVYQFLVDILDVGEKSRESYLRYMNEAETYNLVMSQKRRRGFGSGVHKKYTFIDDSEVVSETLESDFRLEDAENEGEIFT